MQLWKLLNSPYEAVAFESGAGAQILRASIQEGKANMK